MTAAGWRALVLGAVDKYRHSGDDGSLNLLVRHLVEVDQTKADLVNAGISWTGEPTPQLIERLIVEIGAT